MPFKSEKQRRWMFANKPEMAKRWAAEYHQTGDLVGGLQTPTAQTPEELQQVINTRNAELANVSRELGIDPNSLDQSVATVSDLNRIAQDTWGANSAPQLRQATGAGENLSELAKVVGELARQNPGAWGSTAPNPNAIQPAEQQGFWDWAGEQAAGAVEGAGSAFEQAYDTVTGAAAQEKANQQYKQDLENMSAEELLEVLNQRANQAPPQPAEVRGSSIWDKAKGALGALNPVSDANASSRQAALGAAAASLPNPHTGAMGFGTALAGAEGLAGGGGSTAVAPTQQEALRHSYSRAQDDEARRVYNKGFFGGGSWGTETPEQIAQRQQEGAQAFEQRTGYAPAEQGTFLDQQFQHQMQDDSNAGFQQQDRDYWGGGAGSIDMDRTVQTSTGGFANAPTAQGDASIQALLDDPMADLGPVHYDDVGYQDNDDDDHGWDQGATDYSIGNEQDFDTGPSWDYDDEEEAIGYEEPSGGGDDSGGGGGGK